jgi:hypothetical protein
MFEYVDLINMRKSYLETFRIDHVLDGMELI